MPQKRHTKQPTTISSLSFGQIFLRATGLALILAMVLLLLTGLILGGVAYGKLRAFSQAAQVSLQELWQTYQQSQQQAQKLAGPVNLLILGTDSLAQRGDVPPLTDTIMLVKLDLKTGQISTLSLPRDLWNQTYQTKINALLAYGEQRYPKQPELFSQEVIADLTQVPIDHTLVLNLNDLQELINLVGGIEVKIEQGFTDEQFPRPDVDITTETDPAKLYETVTFATGVETMSGERALKYIRSRHSDDKQGHDLARSQRQQQVIQALVTKLQNLKYFANHPDQAGLLYRFYLDHFAVYLPMEQLLAIVYQLAPQQNHLTINNHQLSIYPDEQNGVIYHPPQWQYQNQWVYIIRDQQQFQDFINNKLNNSQT
ncbi:MAG: hypothetical protein GF390_00560 [Candidatus Pacebacteria bacterium]|nr:hypothetical protein [Candidatus Paceibacterota bacterium]